MTEAAQPINDSKPIPRWPAALLLAHLALLIILKFNRGLEPELLWISHVAMGIGAAGFLLRSAPLLALAFVSIAGLHALWLLDAVVGMTTGSFPVGMAMYLPTADAWTWIATSHHAYLAQYIGVFLIGRRVNVLGTFCASFVLFLYLVTASRLFLEPVFNVNRAHTIFLGWDHHFAHNSNALPAIQYLSGLAATVAVLFFFPSAIMLWLLIRRNATESKYEITPIRVNADTPCMPHSSQSPTTRRRRAFTLIELVAVMVVLAILSAVAIPRYFDYADQAKESADIASINDIGIALSNAHLQHRLNKSPSNEWITSVTMIAPWMETQELPLGITINGVRLEDQRTYQYTLTAETIDEPAKLTVVAGSGPGGNNNNGGSGGGGS